MFLWILFRDGSASASSRAYWLRGIARRDMRRRGLRSPSGFLCLGLLHNPAAAGLTLAHHLQAR